MPNIKARAATAADVKAFYPDMTSSFRAWVCEIDGEVQGIIGIALLRPVAGMFSTFREPLRPYLRSLAVLGLIKKAEAALDASRVPVVAAAEPGMATAPIILERLGFERLGEYDGDEVYYRDPAGEA